MTSKNMLKARRAALRNYLEQRDACKEHLYRTLRLAAETEIGAADIKVLGSAIEIFEKGTPWAVRRELEELEKALTT